MAILSIINADVVTQSKGSIIQAIAGSNEGKLAIATTSPNTDKIVGIRIEDVLPGAMGQLASFEPGVRIRMESEPTLYNCVYLSSANAGLGVQAPGTINVPFGICYSKAEVDGVWFAECAPEQSAEQTATDSWINLFDKSLVSLGPESLANGDNVFDSSKSIYVQNRAKAAVFGFTADGLYIRHIADGSGFPNGPQFFISLSNFLPGIYFGDWTEIEVTFKVSLLTTWKNDGDAHFVGFGALHSTMASVSWSNSNRVGLRCRCTYISTTVTNVDIGIPSASIRSAITEGYTTAIYPTVNVKAGPVPSALFYRVIIRNGGMFAYAMSKPGALVDAWPNTTDFTCLSPNTAVVPSEYGVPLADYRRLSLFGAVCEGSYTGVADLLIRNLRVRVR